jgi:hypothetical protein
MEARQISSEINGRLVLDGRPMINRFDVRLICLLYGVACLLSGCNNKHEARDIRDASVATYDYHIKQYIFDGTTLVSQPDEEDSGTFVLFKTEDGIELKESGILIFRGEGCTPGGKGYYFTIPEQPLGYDNRVIIITGFEGHTVDGEKYQAVYDNTTKQITAYFSTGRQFSTSLRVFQLVGTKAAK